MSSTADLEQEIDSDLEEEEVKKEEPKPEEPQEDTSLANSDVVTKYQEAARIVQTALTEISKLVTIIICFLFNSKFFILFVLYSVCSWC